jgi:hypothetical protein
LGGLEGGDALPNELEDAPLLLAASFDRREHGFHETAPGGALHAEGTQNGSELFV